MAFFLKYRPQNFSEIVGQDICVKTLKNAIKSEAPSHAYIFSGTRGTGKTSTARIFAKALNCENLKDGDSCGKCKFCTDITSGDLVDVIEIDAASYTGVENIRGIIEKTDFLPTYAKRKVYIIDEVHMLSKHAFNALLKILEEPPEHVFFILATTELYKIPETIISRCQTFIFSKFSIGKLVERLQYICEQENINTDKESLEMISRQAEGGLRDAISLLEQISAETGKNISSKNVQESLGLAPEEMFIKLYDFLQLKEIDEALNISREIHKKGLDFRFFIHDFLNFLRVKIRENLNDKIRVLEILEIIEVMQEVIERIAKTPIIELPLEIAITKICVSKINLPDSQNQNPTTLKKEAPTINLNKKIEKEKEKEKEITESKFSEEKKPIAEIIEKKPLNGDITSDDIKQKMQEISKIAKFPAFVKKSFLFCSPQILADKINFSNSSSFHIETVDKQEIKNKLTEIIKDIFGKKFIISFSRGQISMDEKTVVPKIKNDNKKSAAEDWVNF